MATRCIGASSLLIGCMRLPTGRVRLDHRGMYPAPNAEHCSAYGGVSLPGALVKRRTGTFSGVCSESAGPPSRPAHVPHESVL